MQRPLRAFLYGPPRRRPPVEHLPNPRVQDVTSVEERRVPSSRVSGERQVVAVPLHLDDNRSEAGPGVEPRVEHDELADRLPSLKEDEAEGGDEE